MFKCKHEQYSTATNGLYDCRTSYRYRCDRYIGGNHTIAAYNGVQNRANDAAVQADLVSFNKLLQQQRIVGGNDAFPTALTASMGFKFSRGAYGQDAQSRNARYCVNTATDQYIIYANSKSGNYFRYTNTGGLEPAVATYGWGVCSQIGLTSVNPSANGLDTGVWAAWVN